MKKRRARRRQRPVRKHEPAQAAPPAQGAPAADGVTPQMQQLTDEELHMLMARDIGAVLFGLMEAFGIEETEAQLEKLLQLLVREQLLVRDQLMPSITSAPGQVGIKLWPRGEKEQSVIVWVDKHWGDARQSAQRAFNAAGYFSFLFSPAVRGILRLVGYDYMFIEPKPKSGPELVVPGR